MSEWKEFKIIDIAKRITSGGTPSTKVSTYYNGKIPWLKTKEIAFNRINKTETKITKEGLNNSSAKWIEKHSVIIAMYGATAAKVGINTVPLTTNQACCNITVDYSITDPFFLFYQIWNNYEELENLAVGAAQQNLSINVISSFLISLPPLPEQKAIAEVLSSLDDKIDLLHRQNETLEQLAETLFREWFVENEEEGWEEGTIFDYAVHAKNSIHPKKEPETLFSHYSIPSFDNGKEPIVELGEEIKSNKYEVLPNSILFSKLNPHRDKRIWLLLNEIPENAVCSTEFQIVKPKKDEYLYFLYGWLSSSVNFREIASGVGGTSGSHQRISPKIIFEFNCPLIKDEFIIKYNNIAAPLFQKQKENQKQIRTLTQMRDTLLPKLMSGEVRAAF